MHPDRTTAPEKNRARWRRVGCVCLVVLLALVGAELVLRHVGYGHSTQPFVRKDFGDGTAWAYNRYCLNRFVSYIPLHMWDYAEFVIPEKKQDDVFRIVVFGGGQANGWPSPQYGFWRMVEAMLRERYPGVRFEVINASFGFTSSVVIREIAEAALDRLDPDLLLLYAGGNEFIGAYGPSNPFTLGGVVPPMPWIRASLWLSDLRVYQWAARPLRRLVEKRPFHLGNPVSASRVARVYRHLETNLNAICKAASRHGTSVVLCTEGANLRSWPPDRTLDTRALSPDDLHRFDQLYDEAVALEKDGDLHGAIRRYGEAEALSATDARVLYRLGRCWWKLGELEEARTCFEDSLERSAYGFSRAKKKSLDIVRRTAETWAGHGVRLADAQERLVALSPGHVPGLEFFADQVHPTLEGAHVIATAAFESIAAELASRGIHGDHTPLDFERCETLLGANATAFAGAFRSSLEFLRSREDGGLGDFDVLEKRLEKVQDEANRLSLKTVEDGLREALRQAGEDFLLHVELALNLVSNGNTEDALREATQVAEAFPWRRLAQRLKGDCEVRAGKPDAAANTYRRLLEWYPDDVPALLRLGEIFEGNGALSDALNCYRKATRENPSDAAAWWHQGQALAGLGDTEHARISLRQAVHLAPMDIAPCSRLDTLLKERSTPPAREQEWRVLVQALQGYPLPRHFLARTLIDQGRADEAMRLYEESASLFPGNHDLVKGWTELLTSSGRLDEAVALYEDLIRRIPEEPNLQMELGEMLSKNGRNEQAANRYLEIMRLYPGFLSSYDAYDALLRDTVSTEERAARWQAIVEEHARSARAWILLGQALTDLDDLNGAADALGKAAELEPGDSILAACLAEVASRTARRTQENLTESTAPAAVLPIESPDQHLPSAVSEALARAARGDLDGAIRDVRTMIGQSPDSEETYLTLDNLLVRRKDDAGRVAMWRDIVRELPDSAMARFCLGLSLEDTGQTEDALEAYKSARQLAPKDERIASRLSDRAFRTAEHLDRQGLHEQAIDAYETAEEVDPDNAPAALAKGVALQTLGRTDLAAEAFRKAIALDPDSMEAYESLDAVLTATMTPEARRAEWQAMVEARPNAAAAQYQLARAMEDTGELDRAIEIYRRAIAIDPQFAPARDQLEESLLLKARKTLEHGEAAEAVEAFRHVLEVCPENAEATCGEGIALAETGHTEAAMASFRKAIALDPASSEPYFRIDQYYLDRGDAQGRLAEWQRICTEHPSTARAQLHLGMALDATGAHEEAIEAFRQSVALDPRDAAKHMALGYALLGGKDFDGAAATFRHVLELNADAGDARIQLILALCRKRAYDEAWQEVDLCLQKGIEVPPSLLDKLAHDSGKPSSLP